MTKAGIHTTAELTRLGLTHRHINKHIHEGTLVRLRRGLYLQRAHSAAENLRAITDYYPGATFAAETALALYGERSLGFPIHMIVGKRMASSSNMRVSLRRPKITVKHYGLRVVTPVDAVGGARRITHREAQQFLAKRYRGKHGQAEYNRHLAASRYRHAVAQIMGTTGTGTASPLEAGFVRALLDARFNPTTNFLLGHYCWDVALEEHRIVIDLDSRQYHANERSFIVDRWKSNDAALHGWRALRYSDLCVREAMGRIIAELRFLCGEQQRPARAGQLSQSPQLERAFPPAWVAHPRVNFLSKSMHF